MLNICDLLQSCNHIGTSFFITFPLIAKKWDAVVRIMGYTANVLWLASFVIIATLALTRLGVVFFHQPAIKWALWQKMLLSLGGLYIFVIWMIGCVTLNFQLVGASWSYDMTVSNTEILSKMEIWFCFPIMVLSFISYILILWSIYKKKKIARSAPSVRTEIAILIQITVLTIYMATIMTLWHNAEDWFEMSDLNLALLNISWILFAHLNSFLLIATNKTIRQEFPRFCSFPKPHTPKLCTVMPSVAVVAVAMHLKDIPKKA